jgi:hypothetical protein
MDLDDDRPQSLADLDPLEVCFIRKRKRPDGNGLWSAYRLGVDRYGTWLFTPQGSLYRGERGDVVGYCNVGSPTGAGVAVLHLVPVAGWWIATFWDLSISAWGITVDICTPPRLLDGVWTYVDLELDVLVEAGTGAIRIDDEDEFLDACDRGFIPVDESIAARSAADDLTRMLAGVIEPFSSVGPQRLAHAIRQRLTPLRSLPLQP